MIKSFYNLLPKVELHAHLNGSLSKGTIQRLADLKEEQQGEKYVIPDGYKIEESDKCKSLSDCFERFKVAYDLVDSKAALILATKAVIKEFSEDNVVYLELRSTPRATTDMTKKDYLRIVVDTMIQCQNLYPNIMVKYLPSINRSHPIPQLNENIDLFIELKNQYPDIVVGLDMSGDPDPNKNKFSAIKPLLEKAQNNGFKLALHCAEIEKEDENLEMLEFGMDRIGHGTFFNSTYKTTWELLMKKRIPIECCLSSNVLCGSVKKMEDHHFQDFFSINYPVCICTDDFGVFDTSLSKEIQICAETFKLSKMDVVKICVDSIGFSFANDKEKKLIKENINDFVENYKDF